MKPDLKLPSLPNLRCRIFANSLTYLINEQDGINEQEGNFPKIINRAGWNKQAGRANFEAIINEQGGKD